MGRGECVRIMTGAVMPAGADTIVIQEVVKKDGDRVTIPPGQKKAQNVRYAGEDLKIGVPVLGSGKLLTPADIGLIASLGIGEVTVKPVVLPLLILFVPLLDATIVTVTRLLARRSPFAASEKATG